MCGIAGFLAKRDGVDVAATITAMLQSLRGRGPDSTGLSLYGAPHSGSLVASVWAGEAGGASAAEPIREAVEACGFGLADAEYVEGYFRLGLSGADLAPAHLGALADGIEAGAPGVRVFSLGRSLELVKHTSAARALAERFGLLGRTHTHVIGHVRMATESRVDVNHSHPFWARPFPDVSVVHNGHVTNYHKNRRLYEMRGHRFQTENDTEFVAVYLADALARGAALDAAVERSIDELDGSFTYLVSTADGFGVARDRFSTKPCLIAETDDWVAVVSEGIALAGAFGDHADFDVYELPGGESRAWTRAPSGAEPAQAAA
jgi:methylamine---glutamate N-methyltransferase subunit A